MMMKEPVFRGAATALVTPLNENGVDYEQFGRLVDWQIEEGIDALVVGMGISATISAALNLFMLRKKMGISTKIVKKLAIFAILSLPTLAITSFVSALLEYCLPMFVNLLLSSMLGVCVFMLFCFVFGVVDLSLFKTQIKNKLLFRKKKNAKVEQ